jgi:hypothetical protein
MSEGGAEGRPAMAHTTQPPIFEPVCNFHFLIFRLKVGDISNMRGVHTDKKVASCFVEHPMLAS